MKDSIDRSVIGALGGILGGLAFILFLQLTGLLIKDSYPKVLHIAHLFIPPGQDHTFWGKILAHTAHFTVAALLGVLFIIIFRLTGRDWATTKGILFGGATWIVIYGIIGKLLALPQKGDVSIAFIMFAAHLIFGIVTSWTLFWLSEKTEL